MVATPYRVNWLAVSLWTDLPGLLFLSMSRFTTAGASPACLFVSVCVYIYVYIQTYIYISLFLAISIVKNKSLYYLHVCVHICTVCVWQHYCVCGWMRIHLYIHVYIYLCIHIYTYTYIHICISNSFDGSLDSFRIYIYIYIHVYMYIHAYMYTYTYVYIHTYMYI